MNMFITGKSSGTRHHTARMLLLHHHNTSPGFLVTLFLKVVFCTKKITLDTTMKTVTDLLTSYFSHVMRKIETNKSQRKQELLAHSKPRKKKGPPFFSQCLKNT